jgi:hypothetical protein
MTAPIVSHVDRREWFQPEAVSIYFADGDKRKRAHVVPGQLWERIAEGKTR